MAPFSPVLALYARHWGKFDIEGKGGCEMWVGVYEGERLTGWIEGFCTARNELGRWILEMVERE